MIVEIQIFHCDVNYVYSVVRCPSCQRCWGIKGKSRKCPHCGTISGDDVTIVSTVESASELQREVAIANMPEQLQDEMRERMPVNVEIVEQPPASLLLWCIKNAAESDIISLERLTGVLRGKGVLVDAEDVAEEGVAQGLLFRQQDGTYHLL